MIEQQEWAFAPTGEVAPVETTAAPLPVEAASNGRVASEQNGVVVPTVETRVATAEGVNPENPEGAADESRCRHVQAGRKGARRVHELIREGKLYEQERGLKKGRQRLRQLIELGKLYEQEHGLRPGLPEKPGGRLSRLDRGELLATLLQCLLRIAKPSFRAELRRLIESLPKEEGRPA